MLKGVVEAGLVAIDCVDLDTGKSRGCGTAFWAKSANWSGFKLLTAKHLAWPQGAGSNSFPVINGEALLVIWTTSAGTSGYGKAGFRVHPVNPAMDYATIHFLDAAYAPPAKPFVISESLPALNSYVTTAGFPGPFVVGVLPKPKFAAGRINELDTTGNNMILVDGRACGGYSGGPAFELIDENTVGDVVIGLMNGQPPTAIITQKNLLDAYLLLAASAF